MEGSLLGEGGARKAEGCGFGARFLAGEKCCCKVLNAGFLNNGGSTGCGFGASKVLLRVGGGRAVEDEFVRVVEDLVRVCPGTAFELVEIEVADTLRTCLDVVIGGFDLSFLTGSGSALEAGAVFLMDEVLCSPPVAGLLMFARGGGGRIEPLLTVLLALGGRPDVDVDVDIDAARVILLVLVGFMGNRLGDRLVLPLPLLLLTTSGPLVRSTFAPDTEGSRTDRVREGTADIFVRGC